MSMRSIIPGLLAAPAMLRRPDPPATPAPEISPVVLARATSAGSSKWVSTRNRLSLRAAYPPPNAVKYFAPTEVLELAGDGERMGQICDSIYEYWREKNAAKSSHDSNRGGRK